MKFRHLESESEIRELISWHNLHSDSVVLDFETTSKDPRQAKLIDIQMQGRDADEAVMFDGKRLPLLRDLKPTQIFWNFKYDWKVAALHGVDLRGKPVRDGMLLEHLVDENIDHDLDSRVQELYGDNYKEQFWAKYKNYLDAPFDERLDYGCRDIYYTRRVYDTLVRRAADSKIPDSLIRHVHRLALSLFDTELEGIAVDLDYTVKMGAELKSDIVATEKQLRELGGFHCEAVELRTWKKEIEKAWTPTGTKWQRVEKPEFNFSSSGQVTSLLYDELKLPPQFNPKTKKRTADDKALERLGDAHPILPEIRKLRKYSKMYGAFVEGILEKVQNGRVYPSFNVNGTVTGRISHSEPNLGQMPSKGDWVKIRGIFVPDPGCKIITCDYGQLEVCIAAHFSLDKNLLRIIREGASKHDITAEGVGLPRAIAKTLNFAMQYQCSAKKVAEIVGCSLKEAEYIWNKYWETYAGEKQVIDECKAMVDRGEPIVSPFGRQRHFPKTFTHIWEKEAAYRQAYSSKIQGFGGDLTSLAFCDTAEVMKLRGWGKGLFTIHDEILLSAKNEYVSQAQQLVQEAMIKAGIDMKLRVPLTVDCSGPLDRWQK